MFNTCLARSGIEVTCLGGLMACQHAGGVFTRGVQTPPPLLARGALGAEHRPARVNIYQTNDEKTIGRSDKNVKLDFFCNY